MTGRDVLPNKRRSTVVQFDHEGVAYLATFSFFRDGRPAEMFLDAGKTGTSANIVAKECSVILSIALQFRVPIQTLYDALPKLLNGSAAGPCGKALSLILEGAGDGTATGRSADQT